MVLRLVEKNQLFIGLIFEDGMQKVQIDGAVADDVWRQPNDEARKANPKYFGFDGGRARFCTGCQSPGYLAEERNYKLAAEAKLDAPAPLDKAASEATPALGAVVSL